MKTIQTKWRALALAAAILTVAMLVQADNPCTVTTTWCTWSCTPGSVNNPGTLSKTNDTVYVGGSSGAALIGTTFNNGSETNTCNDDCGDQWVSDISPISYTPVNWWAPAIPAIFTNTGTFIFTNYVQGITSDTNCPANTSPVMTGTLTVNVKAHSVWSVDFGNGTNSTKKGYAAVGISTNDFWNKVGLQSVANLRLAEGFISSVGLQVTNMAGIASNGSPDAMFNNYVYGSSTLPVGQAVTLTLTNLPSGNWNIYLYASDGSFDLKAGSADYGTQTCFDQVPTGRPIWQQGVHYALYSNVAVTNGQNVTITVQPGVSGVAMISGMQITMALPGGLPPPAGMNAWWRAENNALDSVGTNNGTLLGGLGFAPGEVGQGFNFTNITNAVLVPASPGLDVGAGAGFTVECWINPSDLAAHPIAEWNNGINNGNSYGVNFFISISYVGNLYANLVDSGGGYHVIYTGAGVVTSNVFQHVALTYDKASGVARLYYNGTAVAQQSLGSFTPRTTYDLYLGKRPFTAGATYNFAGLMDEVGLYNRALSPTEIAAIYTAGAAGEYIGIDSDYDGRSDSQESVDQTDPNDPYDFLHVQLGRWRFDNTNTWVGDQGQLPVARANVVGVPGLTTNAVLIDSTNIAYLKYHEADTNGANINLRHGTIRFWFKPDWSSGALGGTGPLDQGRFIEMGSLGTNTGWWTFLLDTNGNTLGLITQTNGTCMTNLTATVSWTSNIWHQLVLTYGISNSSLYIDGQLVVTNGLASQYWPNAAERSAGFCLGSDNGGNNQARGVFDELETFNYPLDAGTIRSNYQPVIPVIISQPGSQSVIQGNSATFNVVASGAPPLSYQWYFNSATLTNATGSTLVITNAQGTNAGTYSVVVGNNFGSITSSNATLTVITPPVIIVQPRPSSQAVVQGTSFSYGVVATGGSLAYQWRLDGTNIVGATFSGYYKSMAVLSDTGAYSLVVTNMVGGVTSSVVNLAVIVPPIITAQPTNLMLLQGGNATFSATIDSTSTQPLSYQWYFNGTNRLGNATNVSLIVTNVQPTNAGSYCVFVTNTAGSATSSNAILAVGVGPVITVQPTNQTIIQGASTAFQVGISAGSSQPLTYQWRFNGVNISGATGASYAISDAQPPDAGAYSVVVTNWAGSVTSSVAVLTILEPPFIMVQPTNQTVMLGSNVTFLVAAIGTTPLGYQWYFNVTNVLMNATNAALIITNAQATGAGNYSVTVSNLAGSVTSSAAILTVLLPPSGVSVQPPAQTNAQGGNATFTATVGAGSTLPLTYQWYFNGNLVSQTTTSSYSNSYTKNVVRTNDAGSYTVTVGNPLGNASASASLAVVVLPIIVQQPTNQIVPQGGSAVFGVVVDATNSTLPLTYQWQLNGSNIGGATNAMLTNATPGTYDVVLSNIAGNVTSASATLATVGVSAIVVDGSVPVIQDSNTIAAGSSINLRALPSPSSAAFPSGWPVWTVTPSTGASFTNGFALGTITNAVAGQYAVWAVCGTSSNSFILTVAGTNDLNYDGIPDNQEIGFGTNSPQVMLGEWLFDTPDWISLEGQLPSSYTNLLLVSGWSIGAVEVNSNNGPALLVYPEINTNTSLANMVCRQGSVRFWFKPDWYSGANSTNGPGSEARFVEMGDKDTVNGCWGLYISPNGTNVYFCTESNSTSGTALALTTNLNAAVNWANDWHEIVLTYCATNSSFYVDGLPVITNGAGIASWPGSATRANGFRIGSASDGTDCAEGRFDNFQTYNYPMNPGDIASYKTNHFRPTGLTNTCALAPIAINFQLAQTLTNGQIFYITNGASTGNFGWLSWNGTLKPEAELTDFNLVTNFTDALSGPNILQVDSWIHGSPGGQVGQVSTPLDNLIAGGLPFGVVLWDGYTSVGSGNNFDFQAAGYIKVLLVGRDNNNTWLEFAYQGIQSCDSFQDKPPVVQIITPTNGQAFNAQFNAPGIIPITAIAFDAEDALTNVAFYTNGVYCGSSPFYVGTTNIGTNIFYIYPFTWTNAPHGTNVITAVATDNHGLSTNSLPVTNIVNWPPQIGGLTNPIVVWPMGGTNVGAILPFTVSDDGLPAGHLTNTWSVVSGPGSVVFSNTVYATNFAVGTSITVSTNSAALFSTNGTYVLQLVADDGFAIGSSNCTVTILRAPVVWITSPTNGSILNSNWTYTIQAGSYDVNGTVTNVQLLDGVASLGNAWPIPNTGNTNWALSWTTTNVLSGTNLLTAIATDDNGLQATSAVVTVTFTYAPPAIQIVSPVYQTILAHSNQLVDATATTAVPGVTISNVQFFVSTNGSAGTTSLGIAFAPTNGFYQARWIPSRGGTYVLTALATDSHGSNAWSAPVTNFVRNLPAVVLTAPANGAIFNTSPTNIVISAHVSADGANITNVVFYWQMTNAIGTNSLNSPDTTTSITWNGVANGTYLLRAVAMDDKGARGFSTNITIIVEPTNRPPLVDAGSNQVVNLWLTNTAQLAGVVSDDGLPLGVVPSVGWSYLGSAPNVVFGNSNQPMTSVSFGAVGNYTFELSANDTQFTNSSVTTVTVISNQAPVVYAGPDPSYIVQNAMQLQGFAWDDGQPDGILITSWNVVSGPGTVTFVDAGVTNTIAEFSDLGTYHLRLTASDGQLTSASDVSIIVTTPNLISYAATNWQYIFDDGNDALTTNFFLPSYNDSFWTNSRAGFANYNSECGQLQNDVCTLWPGHDSGRPYLLLRRHFTIPAGTTNLSIGCAVDNDAQIFVNGTYLTPANVADVGAALFGSRSNNVLDAPPFYFMHDQCPYYDDLKLNGVATNIWHEGDNLLAVRVYDGGVYAFFDCHISLNSRIELAMQNQPPIVAVNQEFFWTTNSVQLKGWVLDDGIWGARGYAYAYWENLSDPDPVTFDPYPPVCSFATNAELDATASFSAPGTYNFVFGAWDGQYLTTNNVTIVVGSPSDMPPAVGIIAPASNSVYGIGAVIPVSATASSSAGLVTNVQFTAFTSSGHALIGTATNSPCTITWTPPLPGIYSLVAAAMDSAGRLGYSAPVVILVQTNLQPTANDDQFTVIANSHNNTLYPLDNDFDPGRNPLVITSVGSPKFGTATIVQNGKAISYTPFFGNCGSDNFNYQISNGKGGTATATIFVNVLASSMPVVRIISPPDGYTTNAGAIVPITAFVSPSTYVTNVVFYLGTEVIGRVASGVGGCYTLANWPATVSACDCGIHAEADDMLGQIGSSQLIHVVATNADGLDHSDDLIVHIDQSAGSYATNDLTGPDMQTIRDGIVSLYGRANHVLGSNVVWQLGVYNINDGSLVRDLTPLPHDANGGYARAVGTAVTPGLLASNCDLTTIPNGIYNLILNVSGGLVHNSATVRFRLESSLKLGQFSFSQQDLVIPANGIPLTVTRTYNSLNPNKGDFGYGWSFAVNSMDVALDETREDASDPTASDGDSTFSLRTGGGRDVTLTLPNGQRTTFYYHLVPSAQFFAYQPAWDAAPGVHATLTAQGNPTFYYFDANSPSYWTDSDPDTYNVPDENYDFKGFTLKTSDGTVYQINRDLAGNHTTGTGDWLVNTYGPPYLAEIDELSGDKITIDQSGVTHVGADGSQRRVAFQRNTDGLITSITDPNGSTGGPSAVKYEYDGYDNLFAVERLVDRNANGGAGSYVTNSFSYENPNFPHYITAIFNGDGTQVAKNFYDDSGKLIAVQDANGKLTQFIHNPTNNMELVIDRLGNTNTYVYDTRGNVTIETNALGKATFNAYDGTNNLLSTTDPLGNTTSYAYDGNGNRTQVVDALHRTNFFSYDPNTGALTGQTDPMGNSIINTYDSYGNLTGTAQLDPQGNTIQSSSSVYLNGQLTQTLNGNNQTTATFAYDGGTGYMTNTTDANGFSRSFGYDANGNQTNSSYVWIAPDGTHVPVNTYTIYDAQGRVSMTIDADGNTNQTFYDINGKVSYTIDKFGNTNSFLYDSRGNLIQTTYPNGTFTRTVYDDNARPTLTTDPNQITGTLTEYDALGRATNTIRLANVQVNIVPDPGSPGQMTSVVGSLGFGLATNSTVYLDNGWVHSRTGPDGQTTTYDYWPDGQAKTVTDPLSHTTHYQYDTAGRQQLIADALNHTNQFGYDAVGRLISTIYADNTSVSNIFNNIGQRVGTVDQANRLTQFGYSVSGQLTNVIKPPVPDPDNSYITNSPAWSYQYDQYGRLTATIDPKGRATTNFYDAQGRQIGQRLPMGQTNSAVYNSKGQLWKQYDFKGQRTEFVYDKFGRVKAKFLFAAGATGPSNAVCYVYNQLNQLTEVVQRFGADATTNACDGYATLVGFPKNNLSLGGKLFAALARSPNLAGGMTVLSLLAMGMAFIPRDKRRRLTEFALTAWDEHVELFSALFGDWMKVLRANIAQASRRFRNRKSEIGNRKFRLPSYGWRFASVMTMLAVLGTEPGFDQLWTAHAQCANPINFSTATTRYTYFTYDLEGNLSQVNSPEGAINYSYDLATGRLTETCTANSQVDYGYDALGRLQTVHVLRRNNTAVNETTTYHYDAVGNRSEVDLPDGVVTTYAYDSLNRLTNMTHTASGGALLANYNYRLDATGRRTNAVEVLQQEGGVYQTNNLVWQFDGMYRLTNEVSVAATATSATAYTNQYVYDLAGNRLQRTRTLSGTETDSYTYNANDELTSEVDGGTTTTYLYDENGSLTNRTTGTAVETYIYDVANKLTGTLANGSPQAGYLYNDNGIRVSSTTGGTTTHYLIDANNHTGYAQVLEELPMVGGTPNTSYVIGDEVLAQCGTTATAPSYFLPDGHGSTRQMTHTDGTISSHYNYDAYGVTQTATSTSVAETTKLYCGEQYDSTLGMYNLRARYYDPSNGRFNQRDSLNGHDEDPQTIHKYLYCSTDPIDGIDPTGHDTLATITLAIGILSVLFSAAQVVLHPSLTSFALLGVDIATLPFAWIKAGKILGETFESLLDLFKLSKNTLTASEIAAKAWLFTQGIKTAYKGEQFLNAFKLGGKVVDWIAEGAESGKWFLVEAKSVLGPDELTDAVGDVLGLLKPGILGKFSNTIAQLETVDRMAGMTFKGVERLVITCRSIAQDKLGDYAIDAATGALSYRGSNVIIQGIQVVVKEIPFF